MKFQKDSGGTVDLGLTDEDLIQELGLCRRPLFGLLSFRIPKGNPMVGSAFAHMLGFSEKYLAGEVSN